MKYTNCREFVGVGENYHNPPLEEEDPNEVNRYSFTEVYKLNPDGTIGEHLRTDPAFPPGWDTPRKILPGLPGKQIKKEDENVYPPRKDREEIMEAARKLMADGLSAPKAAAILKVPASTLTTWLLKEKKQQAGSKEEPKSDNPVTVMNAAEEVPLIYIADGFPALPSHFNKTVNQLTLDFICDINKTNLEPLEKLILIAKQIDIWREL